MTDLERLYQAIENQGISNVNDITYSFYGMCQTIRGKYGVYPDAPTAEQYKHIRKLIKQGRKEGRIQMLSSGRWAQYSIKE